MDKKVWIIGGVIILGGATAYILLNKKAAAAQTTVPSSGAGATGIPAGATGAIPPQGGATDATPGVTITAGSIVPTQTDPVSGITTPIPAGATGAIGSSTGVPSGVTGSIGQGTPAPSGGGTSALGGQSLGLGLTPSTQPAGPLPTGISEAEATALLLDPSTADQVVAAPNNAGNTIFNFVPGPGFGVKL